MSQMPPPAPPNTQQPLNYAAPTEGVDLRAIAVRQRAIMYCILGYIVMILGQFLIPPGLRFVPAIIAMAVSIVAAVFVFMLALSLYGTGIGLLLGVLTLVPLVGLIVLLIINNKATLILRHHGIKVGLMGADPKQIPAPGTVRAPRG